jgi:branched-chain amino acid aminotransferase
VEYVNINGKVVKHSEATLHISDLGLRRGYGAFEFFRILRGIPVFLEDHLNRLENTAHLMGLEVPYSRSQLESFIRELIELNTLERAGIQMVLTGGYSQDIFTPGTPNLIVAPIEIRPQPERYYTEGAKIILHINVREMAHAKSTDYLVAVKLGQRMRAEGATEVVYHDGFMVSEGARSSLCIVRNGVLVTAKNGVLPGITRMHMLRVAEQILPIEYRDIELEELYNADEIILTGATREVMPITQIEDQKIDEVGPYSKAIMQAFSAHVEAYLAAHSPKVEG